MQSNKCMAGKASQKNDNTKAYFLSFDRKLEFYRFNVLSEFMKKLKIS